MDERERREQPMERGHRAQWASGEPPAKPSGLKRARLTTHGNFLNRLLRGLKRARLTTNGNFLNRLLRGLKRARLATHGNFLNRLLRGLKRARPSNERKFPKSSPLGPGEANDHEGGACAEEAGERAP